MNRHDFQERYERLRTAKRKHEVLLKVLAGVAYKQIAQEMTIAESTVRKHMEKIYSAFGIQSEHEGDRQSRVPQLKALFREHKPELIATTHLAEADNSLKAEVSKVSNPKFVGREQAIADLNDLIYQQGAKVIVIQAAGGVGKSTLARQYFQTQGFEVVLNLPMAKEKHKIASVERWIERWLRQDFQQEPGQEFSEMQERLKEQLETRRVGVLIDNLEPALDQDGRFIPPHRGYVELLRVLADPKVQSVSLITSRERLCDEDVNVEHYLLPGLDERAWQKFFSSRKIDIDAPTLNKMHKAYGGNAKAMDLFCGAIRQDFDGNMEAFWRENGADLLGKTDLKNLVTSQFNRLKKLDIEAYRLLCRLGCYRYEDVRTVPTGALLCLLWGPTVQSTSIQIIESLRNRSLVECQKGEYWLHPVIRAEAINRLESEEWKKANLTAAEFWTQSVGSVETVEEVNRALEAYYHYINIEQFDLACKVITKGRPNTWIKSIDGEYLGQSMYRLGLLTAVTFVIDRIPNKKNINIDYLGRLYYIRGAVCLITGELNQAMEYFDLANKIAQDTNCKTLKIDTGITMGFCQKYKWEIEQAIKYFDEVLQIIANERDFEADQVCCWCLLAFLYSSLNGEEFKIKALELAEKAEEQFFTVIHRTVLRQGSALVYLAASYKNLALLYEDSKTIDLYNKSLKNYQAAIKFAENARCNQIKAKAINGLAELDREKKRFEDAILNNQKALKILQEIKANCDIAEAYYQMGLTYQKMRNRKESLEKFENAKQLFKQMNVPRQIERVEQAMNNEC